MNAVTIVAKVVSPEALLLLLRKCPALTALTLNCSAGLNFELLYRPPYTSVATVSTTLQALTVQGCSPLVLGALVSGAVRAA